MADKKEEIGVRITGDSASASQAMRQAADAVKRGVGDMQEKLGGVGSLFDKASLSVAGFAAVLGGVGLAAVVKVTDAFAHSVERTRDLARSLNITTNEVAGLEAALDDIDATTEEYEGAAKMLATQLRQNEKGIRDLGLATRDAHGNLRPLQELMLDGIKVINDYAEGTDRNIAAQTLFGRSGDGSARILMLNTEVMRKGTEVAKELGLEIGGNATEAWAEYNSANDRVGYTMRAFGKAVAETVMPAVTTLMEYFNNTAPVAIRVVRGALAGLTTAFLGLVNGVRLVWEVINAMVYSVAEPIIALGRALLALSRGDFAQAGREIASVPSSIAGAWERAYDNVVDSSATTIERIKRLWSAAAGETGGVGDSGTSAGGKRRIDEKPEKKKHLDSRMGEWDAELAARQVAYQRENDLREMSKEQELAYWQALAGMADVNARERVELRKKITSAELALLKEQRDREQAFSLQDIDRRREAGMASIDAKRQEMQYKVDIGISTNQELLELEQQLEEERYQVVRQAIQDRLALLAQDPTKNVVALRQLNMELEQEERQHQIRSRGITLGVQKEALQDWKSLFDSIGQSFGDVVSGLVRGTMTWGSAVRTLFSSLLSNVASFLGQIVAKKVAAWATEKAIGLGIIGMEAGKAGAGAAASQASIPVVGPALALAAMAAVFAAVIGMKGKASARGGYDIPSGVNPLTQLHEEEMVLPKEQANAIRDMASGGGQIVINATGGNWVHKDDLAMLLRKLNRNFVFTSS